MKQKEASNKWNKQTIYIVPKSTIFVGAIGPGADTGSMERVPADLDSSGELLL